MTGLALGSDIPEATRFDRKNYMYPDLMKGYQISQYELPLAVGGVLRFDHDGESRTVGITRVHLEEDTARLTHVESCERHPQPRRCQPCRSTAHGDRLRPGYHLAC